MTSHGVRHLCVVDGEQHLLGMLSDRDLRTQIGDPVEAAGRDAPGRYLSALRVRHAMTEGARAAVAETPLADLVNIFLVEHVGAVPVVDGDGKVEGVVSYIDVLRAVAAGVAA
jgi:CBS-domain-containing membrane protein